MAEIIFIFSGIAIRSTLDNTLTITYAGIFHSLLNKARSAVRDLDPQNDLTFLRIRTKKNEIMIAPGNTSTAIILKIETPLNYCCIKI